MKQGFRIGKFLSCTNADSPVCVMICKGRLCEEKEVEPNADSERWKPLLLAAQNTTKQKARGDWDD